MKMISSTVFLTTVLLSFSVNSENTPPVPLPQLGADSNTVTVSGFSSGGAMAMQYSVAFSSEVKGVGVIAGIPYDCVNLLKSKGDSIFASFNSLLKARDCMKKGEDVNALFELTKQNATHGKIDNIKHIPKQKVWLFSGTEDATVMPVTMEAVNDYYQKVSTAKNINFVNTIPAGHAFVTNNAGSQCRKTKSPYINNCNYDSAKEMLSWIVGPLKNSPPNQPGELMLFDQRHFFDNTLTSLDEHGFVFVPEICSEQNGCKVHVAFHGCQQNKDTLGDVFPKDVGLNEWADANNIIVLYPQVKTRILMNLKGCWDWWGYTRDDFSYKSGLQMNAVNKMVKHLVQQEPN